MTTGNSLQLLIPLNYIYAAGWPIWKNIPLLEGIEPIRMAQSTVLMYLQ